MKAEVFKIGYLRAEDEQRKLCFKRHQDTEHLLSSREVKFRQEVTQATEVGWSCTPWRQTHR